MKKLILAGAAALALAACGDSTPAGDAAKDLVANSVDEQALRSAVDRAVDEKALEQAVAGTAKSAIDRTIEGAIQEVVPVPSQDLRAFGAAIDERALLEGVVGSVDGNALGENAKRAAGEAAPAQ